MDENESRVDASETLELLRDLVKINSVNPSLVPGAPGEAEIAEYIGEYLRGLGLETGSKRWSPGESTPSAPSRGRAGGLS